MRYRKERGISIGRPPFGTVRNAQGYLKPSDAGAWFIPQTDQFVKGTHNEPPGEDAIWRSYSLCAGYILQIFAENRLGVEKIAYRLKPWADRFLVLRMELYRDEYPDLAAEVEAALGEKESPLTDESQGNDMPHRGLSVRGLQRLAEAIHYGMLLMYIGREIPESPLADHTPTQHDRNHRIRALYAEGKTEMELAAIFDISHQRVSQILRGQRK